MISIKLEQIFPKILATNYFLSQRGKIGKLTTKDIISKGKPLSRQTRIDESRIN